MNPRRRLYAQIRRDMGRLRELQRQAVGGDREAKQEFVEVFGALEVRRIFAQAVGGEGIGGVGIGQ